MQGSPNIGQRSFKKKKPLKFHRFANMTFLLIFLVFFLSMTSGLIKNMVALHELNMAKKNLTENLKIIESLEKQIAESKTTDYIEHFARERLDMLQSGEFIIILNGE